MLTSKNQEFKRLLREVLSEKLAVSEKKLLAEKLNITTVYLNQIISKTNPKVPSLDILNGLFSNVSISVDTKKKLVSLREECLEEKIHAKSTDIKTKKFIEKTSTQIIDNKINREDAVKDISSKLFSNPEDVQSFLSAGFKGFNNLTDTEIQHLYNRYYLELDSSDTVIVINKKPIEKTTLVGYLLMEYKKDLTSKSNDELEEIAKEEYGMDILVVTSKAGPKSPVMPEHSDEAPDVDTNGEDDFVSDSEVEHSEIEEEGDDYDMDDMAWVAPITKKPEKKTVMSYIPKQSLRIVGKQKDIPTLNDDISPEECYLKTLDELQKHNSTITKQIMTKTWDPERDVRQNIYTKQREARFKAAQDARGES